MRELILSYAGTRQQVTGFGHFGFIIRPGFPYAGASLGQLGNPASVAAGTPGRFPIQLMRDGESEAFTVDGPHLFAFDDPQPGFSLYACANGWYRVYLFDKPREVVQLGAKTRRQLILASSYSVPTTDPASSSDGFAMPGGAVSWQAYFGDANQTVELWRYSKDAPDEWCWAEDIDLTTTGPIVGREELIGHVGGGDTADRIYFKAASAIDCAIKVEVEL